MATKQQSGPFAIQFGLTALSSVISLAELLGMLVAGRKSGFLRVVGPTLEAYGEGRLVLGGGGMVSAELGHLQGAEAVLELLSQTQLSFAFMPIEKSDQAPTLELTGLLMECARLEDEAERHQASYPGDGARLVTSRRPRTMVDELNCGAPSLFAAIEKQPRVTAAQLRSIMPLCGLKIRLAVSWLAGSGFLGEYHTHSIPAAMLGAKDTWHEKLLFVNGGGIRILLASQPDEGPVDISRQIALVADSVHADRPEVILPADGPGIVRLRPHSGGLISITILSVQKRHRAIFESLVPGAQLAVIPALDPQGEAQVWRHIVGDSRPCLSWPPEKHGDERLLHELTSYSMALL